MRPLRPLVDPLGPMFMTYELPLTRGYVTLVDWVDRTRIRSRPWRAFIAPGGIVYAAGTEIDPETGKKITVFLHRWLIDTPDGMVTDHIDGDGLNNRRTNLRSATRSQNFVNQRAKIPANKYGYRGISFQGGKYLGTIRVEGQRFCTTGCDTALEAAIKWDELAFKHYGRFVPLNFPAEHAPA